MYSFYDFVCLRVSWKISLSLNTIFIFYQAMFKLVTKELSSVLIHDLYWPCILDHPRSSNKFVIVTAFLLQYYITSNHLVMGSIIVTAYKIKGSFPFLCILRGL